LSKAEKTDDITAANNIVQDKPSHSQARISSSHEQAVTNVDTDSDNVITLVNHRDTLQSFIEKSPLGVQFAIIVLFHLARTYSTSTNKCIPADQSAQAIDLSPFSFTSKEFFDAYGQLGSEMGLMKYLVRHMAFAEFMLSLEYLSLVREDELTANYRVKVDFDDLKWLASLALQQIAGGHSLSSPEIFYPSPPRPSLSPRVARPEKTVSPPTLANTERTGDLIKDLSQSIFSRKENELDPGGGTSRSYDDFARPRSRDYGRHRPYFPNRVPPTTYNFRKPDDGEWKRIIQEFFEDQKCISCNDQVLPQNFDVWIGEPLEDNATPESKRDQTMNEVIADIDDITANSGSNDVIVDSNDQQEFIDSDKNFTDRELLTYSYGIIPMQGRDAFIAFAKPKMACPNCGTNPADSLSLMPKC
jgi:hypothetical protein